MPRRRGKHSKVATARAVQPTVPDFHNSGFSFDIESFSTFPTELILTVIFVLFYGGRLHWGLPQMADYYVVRNASGAPPRIVRPRACEGSTEPGSTDRVNRSPAPPKPAFTPPGRCLSPVLDFAPVEGVVEGHLERFWDIVDIFDNADIMTEEHGQERYASSWRRLLQSLPEIPASPSWEHMVDLYGPQLAVMVRRPDLFKAAMVSASL